jgi:hypothetical protein
MKRADPGEISYNISLPKFFAAPSEIKLSSHSKRRSSKSQCHIDHNKAQIF